MDEQQKYRDSRLGDISRGENIYIALAEEAGVDPVAALNAMPSMLALSIEPEHFLAALGKDNILAIAEARRHFHLPPQE